VVLTPAIAGGAFRTGLSTDFLRGTDGGLLTGALKKVILRGTTGRALREGTREALREGAFTDFAEGARTALREGARPGTYL